MKKLSIASFAVLMSAASASFAQSAGSTNTPFLFPQFTSGTVYEKNGAVVKAKLNYNKVSQEIMFVDDNDNRLVLDQAGNIDSVAIENSLFIPARKIFFEKLTTTQTPLYVQYRTKAVKNQVSDLTRSKSSTYSNSLGVNKFDQKPDKYDLVWPDEYKPETRLMFWNKDGDNYTALRNTDDVKKLFPGKEAEIEAFVKTNNIKFNKIEDMIKLNKFANKK